MTFPFDAYPKEIMGWFRGIGLVPVAEATARSHPTKFTGRGNGATSAMPEAVVASAPPESGSCPSPDAPSPQSGGVSLLGRFTPMTGPAGPQAAGPSFSLKGKRHGR